MCCHSYNPFGTGAVPAAPAASEVQESSMGEDAPSDKAAPINSEEATRLARTLMDEARKHPRTAAAIGIGIGAVAAAMLFASRKSKPAPERSEERRVGKECVRTWRSRGSPD